MVNTMVSGEDFPQQTNPLNEPAMTKRVPFVSHGFDYPSIYFHPEWDDEPTRRAAWWIGLWQIYSGNPQLI